MEEKGVRTLVAHARFHDKTFEFHFSPTREYWDFQKAFVESVMEVRENELHLRKCLERELECARDHLPKKVIIAFSEGSLPADYENKQSAYPLITVEYPLKSVEVVIARLWLEELWKEIKSTEKDEEIRKHKIPKKVNRSIEMVAAMAYTFMRGVVYICNVCDLYSKDGAKYTGIPFLVKKAIIDGYGANYYWLHREEVMKYIETRLAKEKSYEVKQIWARVIFPPFAIPPSCWRIELSSYVDLFLAVHYTNPSYVEQTFPNLEEEIEKIEKNKTSTFTLEKQMTTGKKKVTNNTLSE